MAEVVCLVNPGSFIFETKLTVIDSKYRSFDISLW